MSPILVSGELNCDLVHDGSSCRSLMLLSVMSLEGVLLFHYMCQLLLCLLIYGQAHVKLTTTTWSNIVPIMWLLFGYGIKTGYDDFDHWHFTWKLVRSVGRSGIIPVNLSVFVTPRWQTSGIHPSDRQQNLYDLWPWTSLRTCLSLSLVILFSVLQVRWPSRSKDMQIFGQIWPFDVHF